MTIQTSEELIARYREQAEEALARADRMLDKRDREIMLDVAAAWNRLADLETKLLPQPPSN